MRNAKQNQLNFNPIQPPDPTNILEVNLSPQVDEDSLTKSLPEEYHLSSEFRLPEDSPTESSELRNDSQLSDKESCEPKSEYRLIQFKRPIAIKSRFLDLQKWEGIVINVSKDTFTARLIDLTSSEPDIEAEFSIEEIHEDDRSLVTEGAIFYWSIGYKEDRGQRIRASVIRFRRLPVWQREEIDAAKRDAKVISEILRWK